MLGITCFKEGDATCLEQAGAGVRLLGHARGQSDMTPGVPAVLLNRR